MPQLDASLSVLPESAPSRESGGRAADLNHLVTQLSGRKWVHRANLVIAGGVGEAPAAP